MRGDRRMKGKLEIEVITPLFIGNGNAYSSSEYVFDQGFFNVVNFDKLIESELKRGRLNFLGKFLDDLVNGNTNLKTLCKENNIDYKKYIKYTVSSASAGVRNEVLQFIKTGGKVYIPGSSIKGALRSTLTKYVANYNSELKVFKDSIEKAFEKVKTNDSKKLKSFLSSTLDDIADRKIFGTTNNSPFRFISVSDSDLQEPDILKITEIKILNICNGIPRWFAGIGRNTDDPANARPIFCESIYEKSQFTCSLTVEENLPDYAISEARIKNCEIVVGFVARIKDEIKKYIANELSFFRACGNSVKDVAYFYTDLLNKAENLAENEFLLQVGFGTGMLSKTIIQYLDDDKKSKVAKISMHKYYGDMYPKTRRIVFENKYPKYVPGWIKCRLLPD